MKKAKVIAIEVSSLDFDNTPVENFLCEQIVENNGKHTFTITGLPKVGESHLHAYFTTQSQVTKTIDSTPTLLEQDNYIVNQNSYEYAGNKLSKLTTTSFETNNSREKTTEQHVWIYGNNNPVILYVIKNRQDTLTVKLITDSVTQLVAEEIVWELGKEKDHFYYYYDAGKRLTDVVRYHPFRKKLLPQYIFEYNNQNQVLKKINFTYGSKDYQTWFYQYNEQGLKKEEQCFAKGNLLKGRLVYKYEYE
jgi:hypothetical protein